MIAKNGSYVCTRAGTMTSDLSGKSKADKAIFKASKPSLAANGVIYMRKITQADFKILSQICLKIAKIRTTDDFMNIPEISKGGGVSK
jgi:hypothetical protein